MNVIDSAKLYRDRKRGLDFTGGYYRGNTAVLLPRTVQDE